MRFCIRQYNDIANSVSIMIVYLGLNHSRHHMSLKATKFRYYNYWLND